MNASSCVNVDVVVGVDMVSSLVVEQIFLGRRGQGCHGLLFFHRNDSAVRKRRLWKLPRGCMVSPLLNVLPGFRPAQSTGSMLTVNIELPGKLLLLVFV